MDVKKINIFLNQSRILTVIFYPVKIAYWSILKKVRQKRTNYFCKNVLRLGMLPGATFVKIGANDGISGETCADILRANNNWKGLFVEPVPYCCDLLRKNYPDSSRFIIEQVAIGNVPSRKSFYYVDQSAIQSLSFLPRYYDQLGSFNRQHIINLLGDKIMPFIVESKVLVCTLQDVLERNHIQKIHYLQIDTEGYDFQILKMLDFHKYNPEIIFIEHLHVSRKERKDMRRLLHKHKYNILNYGQDYFALKKSANKSLHSHASNARGGER